MGIFDGLASVLNATFGAEVTITWLNGDPDATLTGIFREEPVEVDIGDGRPALAEMPILKLRRDQGVLVKGDIVAPSEASGRTFKVLDLAKSPSPAVDAFIAYKLEEIT